jgi:hypothetical protein
VNFADILRQCFEGQMIEAGLSRDDARLHAQKAVAKVCRKSGLRVERKLVRLAVYEARVEGATPVELQLRFGLSRRTIFRFIREELELRRIS